MVLRVKKILCCRNNNVVRGRRLHMLYRRTVTVHSAELSSRCDSVELFKRAHSHIFLFSYMYIMDFYISLFRHSAVICLMRRWTSWPRRRWLYEPANESAILPHTAKGYPDCINLSCDFIQWFYLYLYPIHSVVWIILGPYFTHHLIMSFL